MIRSFIVGGNKASASRIENGKRAGLSEPWYKIQTTSDFDTLGKDTVFNEGQLKIVITFFLFDFVFSKKRFTRVSLGKRFLQVCIERWVRVQSKNFSIFFEGLEGESCS